MCGRRSSIAVVISLILSARFCNAAPASTKPTRPLGPLAKARLEWIRATTIDVYEKYGPHDKKWDGNARSVLNAAVHKWGEDDESETENVHFLLNHSFQAIKAGCDDPLVWYARGQIMTRPLDKVANCYRHAAQGMRASHYPAIRKAEAILESAGYEVRLKPDDENVKKTSRAAVDEAFGMLPDVFNDPKIPDCAVGEMLSVIMESSDGVEHDGGVLVQRALEIMEKSNLPKTVVLTAKGRAYLDWAWRTRAGFASDKGDSDARFAMAREALEESERLDPNRFETEYRLLILQLGDVYDPNAMESHFRRAIELDPDTIAPYWTKFAALLPNWHGSSEESIKFGRECAKSNKWSSGAPMVLLEAHWLASRYKQNGDWGAPSRKYFMDSPEIYDECKVVYEQYLKERQPSRYEETRWAVIAAYSGEFKEANAIFKSLGKARSDAVLHNEKLLNSIIKESAEKAKD